MKQEPICINNDVYEEIQKLSLKKGISINDALLYSVRLANSIDDSEEQHKKDIETFLARLRDIPTVSRREIAYCIRNLSRTNRSLLILVEMLREDLDEAINCCNGNQKGRVPKTSVLGTLLYYYEKAFSIPFFTAIFVPKQVPK